MHSRTQETRTQENLYMFTPTPPLKEHYTARVSQRVSKECPCGDSLVADALLRILAFVALYAIDEIDL